MKQLFLLVFCLVAFSCAPPPAEEVASINEDYALASSEYSDLAEKATNHIAALDFDAWGEMLADDLEYYFPDGDTDTRTKLIGKQAVLDWYKDWKDKSGIQSMTANAANHIPVEAISAPNMTGMPGVYVFSYFSNTMSFENGETAAVRMHFAAHFNADKLIDRYYTYYDRTSIINAMEGVNVLNPEAGEGEE